jgi:hypothetical protein
MRCVHRYSAISTTSCIVHGAISSTTRIVTVQSALPFALSQCHQCCLVHRPRCHQLYHAHCHSAISAASCIISCFFFGCTLHPNQSTALAVQSRARIQTHRNAPTRPRAHAGATSARAPGRLLVQSATRAVATKSFTAQMTSPLRWSLAWMTGTRLSFHVRQTSQWLHP